MISFLKIPVEAAERMWVNASFQSLKRWRYKLNAGTLALSMDIVRASEVLNRSIRADTSASITIQSGEMLIPTQEPPTKPTRKKRKKK